MSKDEWDWGYISSLIPIEDVINNPNETWNRYGLSYNKNICMKVIDMDLPNAIGSWNWFWISMNIGMEDVIRCPNEKWNKYNLSMNREINMIVIKAILPNAIGNWDWSDISSNISMEDVINNPRETWNKTWLSSNGRMSTSIMKIRLPKSTGNWNTYNLPERKVHKNISLSNYDVLSIVKRYSRRDLSSCTWISMFWIRFKDRVGICRDPIWSSDISILCV
jgi:hypothetical protein